MATFKQPVTLPPPGASAPAPPSVSFVALAPLDAIPVGLSGAQHTSGPLVVVRSAAGEIRVLAGLCPHKKGELALGDMEDIGGRLAVICPRHRVKFPGGLHIDACSGSVFCTQTPLPDANFDASWRVPTFSTARHEGWLFVAAAATAVTSSDTSRCVGF